MFLFLYGKYFEQQRWAKSFHIPEPHCENTLYRQWLTGAWAGLDYVHAARTAKNELPGNRTWPNRPENPYLSPF